MSKFKTKADAINFAKSAFETNDILSLLKGEDNYSVPINRYVSANMPTDFDYILRVCIYGYFNESNDLCIPEKLKNALVQMLKGDCVSIWCAYSLCWLQSFHEAKANAPFSIIDKHLVSLMRSTLFAKQTELEQCFLWQGKGKERGLWEDIEKSDAILRDKYKRGFI